MIDPESTQSTNRRPERVRYLVEELSKSPTVITIPAPSIAELVAGRAERVDEIVDTLRKLKGFSVQPFDEVIAIEAGERIAQAFARRHEIDKSPNWRTMMKYDAMIAATAIVRGASDLYTMDTGFERYLEGANVRVHLIDDLPLPPEDPQRKLPL